MIDYHSWKLVPHHPRFDATVLVFKFHVVAIHRFGSHFNYPRHILLYLYKKLYRLEILWCYMLKHGTCAQGIQWCL